MAKLILWRDASGKFHSRAAKAGPGAIPAIVQWPPIDADGNTPPSSSRVRRQAAARAEALSRARQIAIGTVLSVVAFVIFCSLRLG